MSTMTFKRVTPHVSRIYQDGDCVGDVYRHDDILNPGSHYYVVHLFEDWRGPKRVSDRRRGPCCYLGSRQTRRLAPADRGPVASLNRRDGSKSLRLRRFRW